MANALVHEFNRFDIWDVEICDMIGNCPMLQVACPRVHKIETNQVNIVCGTQHAACIVQWTSTLVSRSWAETGPTTLLLQIPENTMQYIRSLEKRRVVVIWWSNDENPYLGPFQGHLQKSKKEKWHDEKANFFLYFPPPTDKRKMALWWNEIKTNNRTPEIKQCETGALIYEWATLTDLQSCNCVHLLKGRSCSIAVRVRVPPSTVKAGDCGRCAQAKIHRGRWARRK